MLVSGANQVDLELIKSKLGIELSRADPKKVRADTGFAIGGVSPIGHLNPIDCWIDEDLLTYDSVWAAAGAPNTVFSASPTVLQKVANAQVTKVR